MVLGVQYQLANVWQGRLVLGNKPGRLEKILDFVEQLCTAGEGARKTAATLAGLMNFAGGFVMGHQVKLGTNAWVYNKGIPASQTKQVWDFLSTVAKAVTWNTIQLGGSEGAWVIYTD